MKPSNSLLGFSTGTSAPIPLDLVNEKSWPQFRQQANSATNTWIDSIQFLPKPGEVCLVPGKGGVVDRVLIGTRESPDLWTLAHLPYRLPQGLYELAQSEDCGVHGGLALGWALGSYKFSRYRKPTRDPAQLVVPDAKVLADARRLAEATFLVRDLINTPANDMGPAELVQVGQQVAEVGRAAFSVISGEDLLTQGYPAIYAVGQGSHRAPHLIDIRWGPTDAPKVTLVGKGVCFDSGGLDIKPADNMLLMKKDMGGAAHVLGLAQSVMAQNLRINLRVLIPAVENSISGRSFRPGDVIRTRSGKTVEVGNTDAEGRLILCDALAEADLENPELIIDVATLTGAARVAVGTSIAAMFTGSDKLADDLGRCSMVQQDPIWRLPLWSGYQDDLNSRVADLNNIPDHRYAGAITAALFLQAFVSNPETWVHFDIMGWNTTDLPGRPLGGEALSMRTLDAFIARRYSETV